MTEFALRAARPAAAPRAHLSLDALESRLTPVAQITDLSFCGLGDGWYMIYGQVVADNPWGLTVEFNAASNTIQGQRVEVEQDGSFALFVDLTYLDGGWATATTQDWDGLFSDPVNVNISPMWS